MMDILAPNEAFRFQNLPVEIRLRVYHFLFFDSGEMNSLNEDASIAQRQLFFPETHYRYSITRMRLKSPCPSAIFRVSRAVQAETEAIFYGSAVFNMVGVWGKDRLNIWQFLSGLARRYRRLIRHLEYYHYYDTAYMDARVQSFPNLRLWDTLVTILVQECSSLQSIEFRIHADETEAYDPPMIEEGDVWIQRLSKLQNLENLRYYKVSVVGSNPNRYVRDPKLYYDKRVIYWVKLDRLSKSRSTNYLRPGASISSPEKLTVLPFWSLPRTVRAEVYRHVLLSRDKYIYPYVSAWYDDTTRNAVSEYSMSLYLDPSLFQSFVANLNGESRSFDTRKT